MFLYKPPFFLYNNFALTKYSQANLWFNQKLSEQKINKKEYESEQAFKVWCPALFMTYFCYFWLKLLRMASIFIKTRTHANIAAFSCFSQKWGRMFRSNRRFSKRQTDKNFRWSTRQSFYFGQTQTRGQRSHLARLSEPSSHRRRTVPLQTSSPLFLPLPPLCPVTVRPRDDKEQSVT